MVTISIFACFRHASGNAKCSQPSMRFLLYFEGAYHYYGRENQPIARSCGSMVSNVLSSPTRCGGHLHSGGIARSFIHSNRDTNICAGLVFVGTRYDHVLVRDSFVRERDKSSCTGVVFVGHRMQKMCAGLAYAGAGFHLFTTELATG